MVTLMAVIPAQAGIHMRNAARLSSSLRLWVPAFAGMTR